MEALCFVGAAAALVQLLDVSKKTASSAHSLVHSIVHAPAEIAQLETKLGRLTYIIEQLQNLGRDMDAAELDSLFPTYHRDMLYSALLANQDALQGLKVLQAARRPVFIGWP